MISVVLYVSSLAVSVCVRASVCVCVRASVCVCARAHMFVCECVYFALNLSLTLLPANLGIFS